MPWTHLLPPQNFLEDHPPLGAGTAILLSPELRWARWERQQHLQPHARVRCHLQHPPSRWRGGPPVPGEALRTLDFSPSPRAAAQGLPTPPRSPAPICPSPAREIPAPTSCLKPSMAPSVRGARPRFLPPRPPTPSPPSNQQEGRPPEQGAFDSHPPPQSKH